MRSLKKNQQRLQYATYSDQIKIYERDENGEIVYVDVDGIRTPVIISEQAGYNNPVSFYANIALSSGEAEAKEYGVNASDYEAVIVTSQMDLPITETSIIWWNTIPKYDSAGMIDGDSADFKVISVRPSLNGMKYLLKKITK